MAFRDLDEFFDPTLRLPIRGKTYVVQSVDAKTGLWCQRALTVGVQAVSGGDLTEAQIDGLELDDAQELDLYRKVLGDVYDEMLADGLPWEILRHAGMTAFMWAAGNKQAAEDYWESPGETRREPQDRLPKKSARRGSRAGSTSR